MSSYDSHPGKTPGHDKPSRIVIETVSGQKTYDVEHYVRSEREGWVSLFLTRDGGIDVQVPASRVIEIRRGREHHETPENAGEAGVTA